MWPSGKNATQRLIHGVESQILLPNRAAVVALGATRVITMPERKQGALKVQLSHATGLKSMDTNGYSDPYVKLRLGNETQRSSVIKKTLSPRWDDEVFWFEGALESLIAVPLKVEGWDWDRLSMNDPLGNAEVDLSRLLPEGLGQGVPIQCSVRLNDGQATPGEVFLIITWDGPPFVEGSTGTAYGELGASNGSDAGGEWQRQYSQDDPAATPRLTDGTLRILVHSASGFKAGDFLSRSSDAFVEVALVNSAGEQLGPSSRTHVRDRTKNPTWNDELNLRVRASDRARGCKIRFGVWDEDKGRLRELLSRSNDLLASYECGVEGLIESVRGQAPTAVSRLPSLRLEPRGHLEVSFAWLEHDSDRAHVEHAWLRGDTRRLARLEMAGFAVLNAVLTSLILDPAKLGQFGALLWRWLGSELWPWAWSHPLAFALALLVVGCALVWLLVEQCSWPSWLGVEEWVRDVRGRPLNALRRHQQYHSWHQAWRQESQPQAHHDPRQHQWQPAQNSRSAGEVAPQDGQVMGRSSSARPLAQPTKLAQPMRYTQRSHSFKTRGHGLM